MGNSTVVLLESSIALDRYTDISIKSALQYTKSNGLDLIVVVESSAILSSNKKIEYLSSIYPTISFVSDINLSDKTILKGMVNEHVAMKSQLYAQNNDFDNFRNCIIPMRTIDAKRLMNDIRESFGMEEVKETFKLDIDDLREKYYNKEIFNIGDIVECDSKLYEILNRGSNYLVLIDSNGTTTKKWLQEVKMTEHTQLFTDAQFSNFDPASTPSEISFKGYTTQNLHRAPSANIAFAKTIQNVGTIDPTSVLNALKATDEYLATTPEDIMQGGSEEKAKLMDWSDKHLKAKRALDHCGEFINHQDYWHMYRDMMNQAVMDVKITSEDDRIQDTPDATFVDKMKVAGMFERIAGQVGVYANPTDAVNAALKKSIQFDRQKMEVLQKMLALADEVGIPYDKDYMRRDMRLTKEQVELAQARADKYGRRYPNPIDNAWVISEGKAPPITFGRGEVGSSARLRPDDEKRLMKMNDPQRAAAQETGEISDTDIEKIENYANTGTTSGVAVKPGVGQPEFTHVGASLTKDGDDTLARMKAKKMMHEECSGCEHDEDDMSDKDIDDSIDKLSHDDYMSAYDDDELAVVDKETGEPDEDDKPIKEEALMEVLSKMERMKARLRFARERSKIDRAKELALHKHSDNKRINKRARHLAILALRKKILKGRDFSTLSTDERERIDKIIEKKKKIIGRMAMKLVPKVRKFEKDRLSHKHYTQD